MAEEKKTFGKATVGFGTNQEREIDCTHFLRATYKDNRLITVSEMEDGSFIILVENPESTGRATNQKMWLSAESFMGLILTTSLFCQSRPIDIEHGVMQLCEDQDIRYDHSPNLNLDDIEK